VLNVAILLELRLPCQPALLEPSLALLLSLEDLLGTFPLGRLSIGDKLLVRVDLLCLLSQSVLLYFLCITHAFLPGI